MFKYCILCLLLLMVDCKSNSSSPDYFDRSFIESFPSEFDKESELPPPPVENKTLIVSVAKDLKVMTDVYSLKNLYYTKYYKSYFVYHDFLYACFNQKISITYNEAKDIALSWHTVWDKPFKLDQDILQTYQTHGLEYLLNAFGERPRAFLNNKEKIYAMGWHHDTKAATFFYLCFINGGTMAYDDYIGQYFISFPRQ